MKTFILIACLATSVAWSSDLRVKDLSATEYFRLFDYTDHAKFKDIFSFEKKIIEQAYTIEEHIRRNPDYKAPKKKYSSNVKLAMNLVYAAMMILNNNNGVLEDHIKLEDLTALNHLSDGKNLRQEMIARYDLAARFLKLAMEIAPEDDRIPAWHSANLLRRQYYIEGKVDEAVLDYITDNAGKSPIFHLFNALTMASDYDFGEARDKKLLAAVEFMNSKASPCNKMFFRTGEAKKCNTTQKTPFAFQGVTVYMGDAYLRASAKIHAKNPEEAKKLAEKANALYTRVDWFIFKPKAKKWKMIKLLNERRDLAKGLIAGEDKTGDYFQTRKYRDIYTCVSCHQDGKGKLQLHLRLPE